MKRHELFAAVIGMALVLGTLAGCSTVNRVSRVQPVGGDYQDILIPNKDFQSLGLVFAEYTREGDGAGGEKGEVYTFYKLLQEAQKLGADSIVNVKIEGNYADHTDYKMGKMIKNDQPTSKTWYGSATAIKYTETLKITSTQNTPVGTGENQQMITVTNETFSITAPGSYETNTTDDTGAKKGNAFTNLFKK
ncbi:hypothetical protein AGMMS49579_12330 [Spirochaetia bacterium]|nr:hypothetical protein AGMMS49579_12330 [Spirochaetia bacterium]